jgi:tricorn protease interacting factor F2/3
VLYDDETLKNILSNLKDLSPLDRWGIVSDLYAFLMSGRNLLDKYLDRMEVFKNESDHLVVEEISGQLSHLFLLLPDHVMLVEFSKRFFKSQLERLGEKKADESDNDAILRGTLSRELALIDPEFASKLSLNFAAFHSTDPDMRSALALAEAVAHNSISSLLEQFHSSQNDEDRTKLISAMGWLHGGANLAKAVELIEAGEIKKQDIPALYASVCANPKARDFMLENFELAVNTLRRIFAGTGTPSRMLEQMVPLVGLDHENQVLEAVQKLSSPDIEKGINKGTEFLQIYSRFVKNCAR